MTFSSESAPSSHNHHDTQATGSTLFQLTGKTYFPITLFGRLPYAMIVVGVLLMIEDARNSYADGGITSAMIGVGAAIFGPVLGIISDRVGQRLVLLVTVGMNAAALLVLAWVSYSGFPLWVLMLCAFMIGATAPQLSPLSRARLVNIIDANMTGTRRNKVFQGVMSYESTADEIVFVFGPVLVGVLAIAAGAWTPIIVAAGVTLLLITAFALHPTANAASPAARRTDTGSIDTSAHLPQAPITDLLKFEVLVLVFAMISVGLFFGATLMSLTAFSGNVLRDAAEAGILYGVMGIGSAILALSVTIFPQKFRLSDRLIVFSVILLIGSIMLPQMQDTAGMMLALFIAGCGIGPILVTIYSLGSVRGPYGRSNAIMTMLSSSIIVGQSSATAVVGNVAEVYGHQSALWLSAVSAILVTIFAVANSLHQSLTKKPGQRD